MNFPKIYFLAMTISVMLLNILCSRNARANLLLMNFLKIKYFIFYRPQMSNGTDQERTKLLLERLKVLEAENSSLVLENEQQRQQYEKCLDEIANQVVQALLAQKVCCLHFNFLWGKFRALCV